MENGEKLLLATSRGLAICDRVAGGWQLSKRELSESYITSVITSGNLILAGSQDGIFRSEDRGDSAISAGSGSTRMTPSEFSPGLNQRGFFSPGMAG